MYVFRSQLSPCVPIVETGQSRTPSPLERRLRRRPPPPLILLSRRDALPPSHSGVSADFLSLPIMGGIPTGVDGPSVFGVVFCKIIIYLVLFLFRRQSSSPCKRYRQHHGCEAAFAFAPISVPRAHLGLPADPTGTITHPLIQNSHPSLPFPFSVSLPLSVSPFLLNIVRVASFTLRPPRRFSSPPKIFTPNSSSASRPPPAFPSRLPSSPALFPNSGQLRRSLCSRRRRATPCDSAPQTETPAHTPVMPARPPSVLWSPTPPPCPTVLPSVPPTASTWWP